MAVFEDIKAFFKEQETNGFFLVDIKGLPLQRIQIFDDTEKGITIDE